MIVLLVLTTVVLSASIRENLPEHQGNRNFDFDKGFDWNVGWRLKRLWDLRVLYRFPEDHNIGVK